MSDERLFIWWAPLFVIWLATVAVRFVPPLRDRFDDPRIQRGATLVGWGALAAILVIVWVLPRMLGGGA